MPEGDTVHLAATRLHAALAGKVLTRTEFRVPRYATVDLSGRRVDGVVSHGKHLLMRISDGTTVHSHFRMEGSWHLYRAGEAWRGPGWQVRALLVTEPWTAVGFRLAMLDIVPTARESELVGHLGPDPLRGDWDPQEALRRLLADPQRSVSEALLDQRVIAGIGNIYRCELCFLRGLHPTMPVGALRDPAALVQLTKRVFEANRAIGSQVTTGDPRAGQSQYVYGRVGEPCRRCRTPIARDGEGDRVTFWCPRCQARI